MYLPTPPHEQDTMHGQFLCEFSFPSPKTVTITKAKEPSLSYFTIVGVIPFPKGISAM